MVKYMAHNNHSCLENKDNIGSIYNYGFSSCRSFLKVGKVGGYRTVQAERTIALLHLFAFSSIRKLYKDDLIWLDLRLPYISLQKS